ncbi:MAG: hypothetical protein ACI3ZL_09415 [Candidatus Cryptobacteroides sp.]
MKRLFYLLCALAVVLGCDTEARYTTRKVTLTMDVLQVSCGFCEVMYSTDKDAYYYIAAEKVRDGIDPMTMQEQFKTLALDYAYKEYINWRYNLLFNGEPHIAEFSSHSLQYGEQNFFFTDLEPDTDYWVYGFIVDPASNKPAGDLVIQTVHTKVTSEIKVNFKYRIDGLWDYVYPLDEDGVIDFNLPWVGETVDSLMLRDELKVQAPGRYFIERMTALRESGEANIFYGMYAHNNDGYGDGTSETSFEEGHTYYTAMASFDGPLILEGEYKNYSIYKFTWYPAMQRVFTSEDDTLGAW